MRQATAQRTPRWALPALCITQITSWGITYYAFPVLNAHIINDTHWPTVITTAAFSCALVVSAIAGMAVGKHIDRHGPRRIMTAGSALGAASLTAVALAPNLPLFFAAWLAVGLAMSATLYPPAFAATTRWWYPRHLRPITLITICGGLASTAFAPFTAALADQLSWRTTYLVLAGLLAGTTIPLHATALNHPWPPPRTPQHSPHPGTPETVPRRPLLILGTSLTLAALANYAFIIALVPLLLERGYTSTQAAWALGLGGAGQTIGRAAYAHLAARTNPTQRLVLLTAGAATTMALFATAPGPYALVLGMALTAGALRGNLTLFQATITADQWGTHAYGKISGFLAAPTSTATALAPMTGPLLATATGSYSSALWPLTALVTIASVTAIRF